MVILFLLGLAFGSFLNVLIFRYDPDKKFNLKTAGGRSRCLQCGHTLNWYELIPVLSWVVQLGKCRACGKRISLQYPIVELAAGAVFAYTPAVLVYLLFNVSVVPNAWLIAGLSALWILVSMCLLAAFFIDLRHFVIPNGLNFFIFLLGAFWTVAGYMLSFGQAVSQGSFLGSYTQPFYFSNSFLLNHALGAVVGAGFFLAVVLISRGKGMGMGDVKLTAGLGLLFGFPDIIGVMAISFVLGTLYSLPLLVTGIKRMKDRIPFGPFLVIAAFVAFFFGARILQGYFAIIQNIGIHIFQ